MKDTETRDEILKEREDLVRRFEEVTKGWIVGDNVVDERNKIAHELNENYWKLDPYVRARTLYDRMGVIGGRGGFIYPTMEKSEKQDMKNR